LSPSEAFRVIKPYLDKGIDFYFTINPTRALKWAANTNQYAIATAIMKHEERLRLKQQREMIDLFKVLLPIGILIFMLAMAFYIVVMAVQPGTTGPLPMPKPPGGVNI